MKKATRGKTRGKWIMWTGLGVVALAVAAFIWMPFSRPSLESSTIVLTPPPDVAAPAGDGDVLTVLYSGDGGWADLDKQLGNAFQARGIPVLGINCFKYFWRARDPDVAAAQLNTLITDYLAKWHKQRVWLVGFSFGADVLPSLIDRLPAATRAHITQLVLLSPSHHFTYEIQFEGYMMAQGRFKAFVKTLTEKFNKVPEYPTLPPVIKLDNQFPVVCYYGEGEEDDSLCTEPNLPHWVIVHGKPGGHHFKGGYQPLAAEMIAALPTSASSDPRTTATTPPASAASAGAADHAPQG